MATLELDPLFLKALTLLRSKSRESTDQLKALLDEVLGKKTKGDSGKTERDGDEKQIRKKEEKDSKLSQPPKKSTSLEERKLINKRPLDKLTGQSKSDSAPLKKPKVEIPKKASVIRKPVIDDDEDEEEDESDEDAVFEKPPAVITISSDSDDHTRRDEGTKKVKETTSEAEEAAGSTNMDDFALELGLACVVCKKMDVSAKNQLIECQECHNLYHQFCHKPAATDADASDPRLVWYCAKCQRNMRKSVDKKPVKLPSMHLELSTAGSEKKSGEQNLNLFKRSEPKTPPVSSVSKSQPFTGFANFAANVSGKSSSSKSSSVSSKPSTILGVNKSNIRVNMNSSLNKTGSLSSSSNTSRTIVSKFRSSTSESRSPSPQPSSGPSKSKVGGVKNLPQTSQVSAMKRLQQMKKKASKR